MKCENDCIGFSIVIPVYNIQDFLTDCIQSILNQNYESYEIILVNDGSTDDSGSICDYFAQKYTQISAIHQDNAGLSNARNVGIRNAKMQYIVLLDGDDMLYENALLNLHNVIYNAECPDLVMNRIVTYDGISTIECQYFFETKLKDMTNAQAYTEIQRLPDFFFVHGYLSFEKNILRRMNCIFMKEYYMKMKNGYLVFS